MYNKYNYYVNVTYYLACKSSYTSFIYMVWLHRCGWLSSLCIVLFHCLYFRYIRWRAERGLLPLPLEGWRWLNQLSSEYSPIFWIINSVKLKLLSIGSCIRITEWIEGTESKDAWMAKEQKTVPVGCGKVPAVPINDGCRTNVPGSRNRLILTVSRDTTAIEIWRPLPWWMTAMMDEACYP